MKIDKYFHLYGRKDDVVFEEIPAPFKWIPVSERLPEDSYGCIVAYHGFMMTPSGEKEYDAVYHETVGFDGQGWNNANGENIDNLIDVTAWMPLPEPYKEERE